MDVKRVNQPHQGPAPDGQGGRFIAAARELGCDEDGAAFERKLKVLAEKKQAAPPKKTEGGER